MCLNQQNCNRQNRQLLFNNLFPVNFKMYTNIALIHSFSFKIEHTDIKWQLTTEKSRVKKKSKF